MMKNGDKIKLTKTGREYITEWANAEHLPLPEDVYGYVNEPTGDEVLLNGAAGVRVSFHPPITYGLQETETWVLYSPDEFKVVKE